MHKHILNRLSKFTTPLLVVGLVVFGLAVATQMADATRDNDGEHKVNICHATDSDTNPYVKKTDVDFSSILGQNGHDGHNGGVYPSDPWGDIIPPFEYKTWEVVGSHQECPANSSAYNSSNSSKPCKKWKVWHWQYAEYITVNDYDWVTHQYPGKNWPEGEAIYNNGCQIPSPAIEAQKVICDAEQYLPNGQVSDPITDQTATDYVENSDGHCWLAEDWNFKWWWGNAGKHQFSVSSPATIPTDKGTIKVMEVLPDDYLGFSNSSNDYTAEFYCGNDVTNYDNEEWLTGVKLGMTYQCVGFNVEKTYCGDGVLQTTNDYNETEECDGTDGIEGNQICSRSCEILEPATVNVQKVVCEEESQLPNWGDGGDNEITSSTASEWDTHEGCDLVPWSFQWRPDNTDPYNPGDNLEDNNGIAGGAWSEPFGSSVEIPANLSKVWLREVWNPNYIPFTYESAGGNSNDESAEFYCNDDVLNYDNLEWLNLQPGQDYYCVGWNVMKTGTVTFYKDVRWNNDKVDVDDNTAFGVNVDGEYKGDVSENSPLVLELPIGTYQAEEVLPAGYAGIVDTAEFTVETDENTDVYFENQLACSEGATWAYGVVDYSQGSGVSAARAIPEHALGPADSASNSNAESTFVSLGKNNGSLTIMFEYPVQDVPDSDDISVHEVTNGRLTYAEELAKVEASYDGTNWYYLGDASSKATNGVSYFDLADVGLPLAKYIRLTDMTTTNSNDGFDVDAIDATYGFCKNIEPSYIQGKKFADVDYDGARNLNNGDYFMNDWTIRLYDNTWTQVGIDHTTGETGTLGQYKFTNLYPNTTYYVCEVQKDGWYETFPNQPQNNKYIANGSGNADEAPYCFIAKIGDYGKNKTGLQFGNYQIMCGDGYIHGDESCDDGQMNGQPGYCSAQCDGPTLFCGDQTVTPELGEQCDGNTQACVTDDGYNGIQSCYMGSRDSQSSDTQISCTWIESCDPIESCGDEIVNGNEQCDDGNITSGDGCSQSCTLEETHFSIVKSVLVNGEESLTAEEGDTLTYTITVQNTGETNESNLYLEDTTPTNTTLVADSWGGDLGDPVMNPDDSFTFGPFSLASGETISVTFDVTVNAGLPIGVTNIENQATLYQALEEEAEENLEATNFLQKLFGIRAATAAEANWSMIAQSNIVLTTVTIPEPEPEPEQPQGQVLGDETVPALSIEKTVNKAFANAGDTVTYTIVVTNTGDALAEGVTLIDTLPAGMHYTDTVAMDHSWVLGDIMDGDSKTVTYDVVINKGATPGSYTNTVVGWAAGVDNVTDTATLEVRLGAVLGAETLPVTGAGAATLAISTLAGLAAVILTNRKRK